MFHKVNGLLVGSYEFTMPLADRLAIIGSQEGFVFFDFRESIEKPQPFNVTVRKIETANGNQLLFGGTLIDSTESRWPYAFNSLKINFAAQYYENPEKISYQYCLVKEDAEPASWSGWTNNTQVDFSELSEGAYVFYVRARNIYDQQSEECIYRFSILPPWYRSWQAYVFYSVLLLVAGTLAFMRVKERFIRQKIRLENEKEKELLLMQK